jgi:hypothetical protein
MLLNGAGHIEETVLPFFQYALLVSVTCVQLKLITILGNCGCQFPWCALGLTVVTVACWGLPFFFFFLFNLWLRVSASYSIKAKHIGLRQFLQMNTIRTYITGNGTVLFERENGIIIKQEGKRLALQQRCHSFWSIMIVISSCQICLYARCLQLYHILMFIYTCVLFSPEQDAL